MMSKLLTATPECSCHEGIICDPCVAQMLNAMQDGEVMVTPLFETGQTAELQQQFDSWLTTLEREGGR